MLTCILGGVVQLLSGARWWLLPLPLLLMWLLLWLLLLLLLLQLLLVLLLLVGRFLHQGEEEEALLR